MSADLVELLFPASVIVMDSSVMICRKFVFIRV